MKNTLPLLLCLAALADCTRPAERASDAGASTSSGAQSEEACVDQWLKAHQLDSYGNPEGTMYAGGTPLFDERTGERRERLPYVYEKQPAAKQACASGR